MEMESTACGLVCRDLFSERDFRLLCIVVMVHGETMLAS